MKINLATSTLIDCWQHWKGGIDCHYSKQFWPAHELVSESFRLAHGWIEGGMKRGDVIAIVLSNTAAYPVALFAALLIDANPLLLYAGTLQTELADLGDTIKIDWIVHDFIKPLSCLSQTDYRIVNEFQCGTIPLFLLECQTAGQQAHECSLCGVFLQPSSGTYGTPRICVRAQEANLAEAANYINTITYYRQKKIRITTNLNHAYALGFGLMSSILSHSILRVSNCFNPKVLLRQESEAPSDMLALVPAMLPTLNELKYHMKSVTLPPIVTVSGTSCDYTVAEQFCALFNTQLHTIYGSTETGAISTNIHTEKTILNVGQPLANVKVSIRNRKKHIKIGNNIGEVWVKSPSMMLGYLFENPLAALYFSTGDLACVHNKSLILTGRIKDVINCNGIKIDPRHIEAVLYRHPLITDCVVYPGRHKKHQNELICAAFTSQDPITASELKKFCYAHLSANKIPHCFYRLDKIPRSASGKCLMLKLPKYNLSNI